MKEAVRALLGHPGVWLGDGRGAVSRREILPTGRAALDGLLPGGGWPVGAVTEILFPGEGIGELRLLLPSLVALSLDGRRIAWVDPPHLPYAPALMGAGAALSRFLVVRPGASRDRLFAASLCLRSGACGAVLAWPAACDDRGIRRLQLAAEQGRCAGFLFLTERACGRFSPAALRLRLSPSPGGVTVEILKGWGGAGRCAEVPLAESREGIAPAGCIRPEAVHV